MKDLPKLEDVTKKLAEEYPEDLRNASDGNYKFLDRCIQKLNSIDPNFGYRYRHRGGNPNDKIISFDCFAYYLGDDDPKGKTNSSGKMAIVDFIIGAGGPNPSVGKRWHIEKWSNDSDAYSQWVFPRPGSPDYYKKSAEAPTEEKIISGKCGEYKGDSNLSCVAGEFHPHPGHTPTHYRWTCRNIPHKSLDGKREDTKSQPKPETLKKVEDIVKAGPKEDQSKVDKILDWLKDLF